MKDLIELEVGKTYVFKDEDSKRDYLEKHYENRRLHNTFYKEGYTLDEVSGESGYVGDNLVIAYGQHELKYFKLKDSEEFQATDTFTKADLKDGMLVQLKGWKTSEYWVLIGGSLVGKDGHNPLEDYDIHLRHEDDGDFNIEKIYGVCYFTSLDLGQQEKELIWERPKEVKVLPTESKPDFEEELLALKQEARTLLGNITSLEGKIL